MQKEAFNISDKSQEELVAALKANNEPVMKEIYIANYSKVKTYVLQNNGSESDAKDVYQEAFIAVWRNVRSDKFTPQNDTSLSGYLYQIARNKWLDTLRSAHHKKTISESNLRLVSKRQEQESIEAMEAENENIEKIMIAFGRLGEHCKTILQQFYFNHKSYRDIAEETDMKEASVRNQKYRCMQELNDLVRKSKNN